MKTLDRYIGAAFLKNFLLAVMGLTLLYVFQALMSSILAGEFPFRQVVIYNFLQAPEIFTLMAPPSVLLGTVFTLSGLNRTAEMTACFSIGMGLRRVIAPIIVLVILLCGALLYCQNSVLPPVFKSRTLYYWRDMKNRTDFHLDIKQNKIWYRSKNLIYNLKLFDTKTQLIRGMTVYSFNSRFQLEKLVEAESAEYSTRGWKLFNGTITQFEEEDPFPITEKFREVTLQIPETPKEFMEIEKEVRSLKLTELQNYIHENEDAGLDMKSYLVQYHSRFSLSFIPLIMCILAVPFSVRGRREGGVAKDLGICLAITFFYWLFYSIGLSLGTNGALPAWIAAWAPTLVFGVLAIALVFQQQK
jgi:lipopolysaccharide export system permease protein